MMHICWFECCFIFFHFLSLGWFLCVWKNFKYVAFKHLFNILKNDSYRVTRRKDLLSYTISVDYFCWDICKQNSSLQLPCTWIKSMHLSLLVKLHGTHQFSSHCVFAELRFITFYWLHVPKLILHPRLFKTSSAELTIQTCHLYLLGSTDVKFS